MKFEEGNQAEKKQAELERLAQNKMYDYLQELNQHKARLTSLQEASVRVIVIYLLVSVL